jgi:histidyl-tRNA synthetase
MEIASRLWAAGIKAEFGFKPNPKMGDQLNHAFETAIPFMVLFGDDELSKGVVKIKVWYANKGMHSRYSTSCLIVCDQTGQDVRT